MNSKMKVLWITNFPLPDVCIEIGILPHKGGSWMYSLAKQLSSIGDIELCILSFYNNIQFEGVVKGINYVVLPTKLLNDRGQLYLKYREITEKINPDLLHIHGTESAFGLYYLEACPNVKSIVSIQGLVEIYSRYFYGSIGYLDMLRNTSLVECWRKNTFYHQKKFLTTKGKNEVKYFLKTDFVLGRTNWDYSHSKSFNNCLNYRFCNETLRNEFYTSKKWDIQKKVNYSIFVSQASYPIKGFHILLKAVSLLKREFPLIEIRVAGEFFSRKPSISDKLKLTGYWYGKYIHSLIEKFNLSVTFLGVLNTENMRDEFLNCHVTVCPSSIENSPNSIGEAQILGTPVIASYVGGVPDMVHHGNTGLLYRFEEPELLANCIRRLFTNNDLASEISMNAIVRATERHSSKKIVKDLLSIYSELINVRE
ncbi:MAG: glycosyltransferase family 4 protein [Candidatus Staskawiczbacteria bacterium]|nr:glycosyltransferase family 4 protein [Candidatus Staskawiczbacteria bacterium]